MATATGYLPSHTVPVGGVEPVLVAVLRYADAICIALSLVACHMVFHVPVTRVTEAGTLLALVVSSTVFSSQAAAADMAPDRVASNWTRAAADIMLRWVFVIAALMLVAVAFSEIRYFPRRVVLMWVFVTPLLLLATHFVRARAQASAVRRSHSQQRAIIVGANAVGAELARRLPAQGFLGFFDFRSEDRVSDVICGMGGLAGHGNDVASFVRQNRVSAVYIALPMSKVPRIDGLVCSLRDTTASIHFVPDTLAFNLIQGRVQDVHGLPVFSVCDTPFQGNYAAQKRAMDFVAACAGLLLLWPVMLVAAIAVKLSSSGPVLFRQRRYGLNGEEILVYKFRSMTVCEDGARVTQARRNDQRVTRVGNFLRRTSLDELPQLINVVQGKMSIVGPRPHAIAHNEQYRKLIDGYMVRHKVKPGITGLAQVSGLRGETETVEKMAERVAYDLEYLRQWSPALDLSIILRTVAVIWSDKNAY